MGDTWNFEEPVPSFHPQPSKEQIDKEFEPIADICRFFYAENYGIKFWDKNISTYCGVASWLSPRQHRKTCKLRRKKTSQEMRNCPN
jgi:peptide methionine sulfoxide reductase MsrA